MTAANYKLFLSKSCMLQIPQTNKDLVLGFIVETFKQMKENNLPQLVVQWCMVFFNPNVDEWDPKQVHPSIKVKQLNVKRLNSWGYKSAHLFNVVSSGIHVWKFRFVKCGYFDCIGLRPAKLKMSTGRGLDYFEDGHFHMFGSEDVQVNDIIDMRINFIQLMLTFAKNDVIIAHQKIQRGEFRAAVSLSCANAEIELLAYQHFFVKCSSFIAGFNIF